MKKLVLEGEIQIWDQEGGQCSPAVYIGDEDLTSKIEDFVIKPQHLERPRKWRVTVELCDE